MKTLYVRIQQRQESESFWRCATQFSKVWKKVSDLDDATAQRLKEEQMLEVTDTCPPEFEETNAGDSAAVDLTLTGGEAVTPAAVPATNFPVIDATLADSPALDYPAEVAAAEAEVAAEAPAEAPAEAKAPAATKKGNK